MTSKPDFILEDDGSAGVLSSNCDVYDIESAKAVLTSEEALRAFHLMNEVEDRGDIEGITVRIGELQIDDGADGRWQDAPALARRGEIKMYAYERDNSGENIDFYVRRPQIESYLLTHGLISENDIRGPRPTTAPTP